MANTKSAKKCVRQIAKRTAVNKSRISRIRTFYRKANEAAASVKTGMPVEDAKKVFVAAEREIMRGVTKGVFHKNTASRKVSQLAKRLKKAVIEKISLGIE